MNGRYIVHTLRYTYVMYIYMDIYTQRKNLRARIRTSFFFCKLVNVLFFYKERGPANVNYGRGNFGNIKIDLDIFNYYLFGLSNSFMKD